MCEPFHRVSQFSLKNHNMRHHTFEDVFVKLRIFKFNYNMATSGTFHKDLRTIMINFPELFLE